MSEIVFARSVRAILNQYVTNSGDSIDLSKLVPVSDKPFVDKGGRPYAWSVAKFAFDNTRMRYDLWQVFDESVNFRSGHFAIDLLDPCRSLSVRVVEDDDIKVDSIFNKCREDLRLFAFNDTSFFSQGDVFLKCLAGYIEKYHELIGVKRK